MLFFGGRGWVPRSCGVRYILHVASKMSWLRAFLLSCSAQSGHPFQGSDDLRRSIGCFLCWKGSVELEDRFDAICKNNYKIRNRKMCMQDV
jgi:hypothetical protein